MEHLDARDELLLLMAIGFERLLLSNFVHCWPPQESKDALLLRHINAQFLRIAEICSLL